MDTAIVKRHFERIGAQLEVEVLPLHSGWNRWQKRPILNTEFDLDVVNEGTRDEGFKMRVRDDLLEVVQLQTLNIRPKERHLLLMLKRPEAGTKEKFLCGHDERHWFVAAVNEKVRHVDDAIDSLRPFGTSISQARHKVRRKNRNKRRNKGFVRQGEWFFIPEPRFTPPTPEMILTHEPLQRPRSKPHIVAELYRTGGQIVYVNRQHPNGISAGQYTRLIRQRPSLANDGWRIMRRNPQVYVRGTVKHPDHATITLPFWHRVAMNVEAPSARVAFLD